MTDADTSHRAPESVKLDRATVVVRRDTRDSNEPETRERPEYEHASQPAETSSQTKTPAVARRRPADGLHGDARQKGGMREDGEE